MAIPSAQRQPDESGRRKGSGSLLLVARGATDLEEGAKRSMQENKHAPRRVVQAATATAAAVIAEATVAEVPGMGPVQCQEGPRYQEARVGSLLLIARGAMNLEEGARRPRRRKKRGPMRVVRVPNGAATTRALARVVSAGTATATAVRDQIQGRWSSRASGSQERAAPEKKELAMTQQAIGRGLRRDARASTPTLTTLASAETAAATRDQNRR